MDIKILSMIFNNNVIWNLLSHSEIIIMAEIIMIVMLKEKDYKSYHVF